MPKISLSGPADLLTIIPFHLGFQPARSVVVVCFHGRRLGLVARLDLVDADLAVEAAAGILPTLLQGDPSSVALVGFEDDRDESLALIEALASGAESERVVVRERLVVRDGRWWSVGCDCCPEEGRLLPEQADVPAVASYVALGHAVLADREELARVVEPLAPSGPRHDLALAAIADWQRRYEAAGGSVSGEHDQPTGRRCPRRLGRAPKVELGVLDGGDPSARQFLVNDALVAWGGVLHGEVEGYGIEHWLPSLVGPLRDLRVRDALLGWLCPGMVDPADVADEVVVMLELLLGRGLRLRTEQDQHGHAQDAGRSRAGSGPKRPDDESPLSGTEVGARLPDADVEELRALYNLLDRDASGIGGRGAREDTDDDHGGGPGQAISPTPAGDGERWSDWEKAATPRLVLSRLEQVCRLTPADHAAPLLSVVAAVAWWSGDGARAGVAADRALELDPDSQLGRVVRDSLDVGMRPPRCA